MVCNFISFNKITFFSIIYFVPFIFIFYFVVSTMITLFEEMVHPGAA